MAKRSLWTFGATMRHESNSEQNRGTAISSGCQLCVVLSF